MENQNTPLWDASLSIEKRLDWLLEAMNLDEKCRMLSKAVNHERLMGK